MAYGITTAGVIGEFFARLQSAAASAWWSQLVSRFESDQASETYNWLGNVPAVREWKGDALAAQLRENRLTIVNKTWEASIKIGSDDFRRDKSTQIVTRISELAKRVANHPAKLLSTLIANGTGDTNGVCSDGQYFLDTDHAEGESGTQTNVLAAAQVSALNVGTATAPTPAEMAAAILGVIAYMRGFKDDQGEPMNEDAERFLVLVPSSLFGAAYAATVKESLVAASGTVVPNVLSGGNLMVSAAVDARSAWTDTFAVFRTDGSVRPFIFQEELPVELRALGEGSEYETEHNEHKYTAKSVNNVGYGVWQHAAIATLS